jgi:kumamolisin
MEKHHMLATFHRTSLAASLALLLAGTAAAAPAGDVHPSLDMGLARSSQPAHVTLMLKTRNEEGLERFIQQTVTPGSPNFQVLRGFPWSLLSCIDTLDVFGRV